MGESRAGIEEPVILREGEYTEEDVRKVRERPIWRERDLTRFQLEDLFEMLYPAKKQDADFGSQVHQYVEKRLSGNSELVGDWIYYPWSGLLLHTLGRNEQFRLRTNRNHNLITLDEQHLLTQAHIAVAGLSVGSGMAVALAYAGAAGMLRLADFDSLSTSNLNRVRAGLADVGESKSVITARQIWSIDPYLDLRFYLEGLSEDTLPSFLGAEVPVAVAFDEIDDFLMKVRLRHEARRMRVPVVMFSGLGDSVLIDIERYDLDPDLKIFNGLIGDVEEEILSSEIGETESKRYAAQIVGVQDVPTRALQSLLEIGDSLVGRPQLGSTVMIEGGLAPFVVRQIILGAPLRSGRYRLALDEVMELPDATERSEERSRAIEQLLKKA